MPTILLTNDDGIQSVGLLTLRKKLEKLGDLIVVAPEHERSGIGKALSTTRIQITETRLKDGSKAYAITGTPGDAFLLAANKILKRAPDLLVAGINLGPNLAIDDLLNSGTLGAALEATIHHVPAIAVSYCIGKMTEHQTEKAAVTEEELEPTATIARKTAEYVLQNGMPPDVDIISINVPERIDSDDVEITDLSYKGYGDIHTKKNGGYKILTWALESYPDDVPGTDIHTIKERKCISVTPIQLKLLHNRNALEGLSKALRT